MQCALAKSMKLRIAKWFDVRAEEKSEKKNIENSIGILFMKMRWTNFPNSVSFLLASSRLASRSEESLRVGGSCYSLSLSLSKLPLHTEFQNRQSEQFNVANYMYALLQANGLNHIYYRLKHTFWSIDMTHFDDDTLHAQYQHLI